MGKIGSNGKLMNGKKNEKKKTGIHGETNPTGLKHDDTVECTARCVGCSHQKHQLFQEKKRKKKVLRRQEEITTRTNSRHEECAKVGVVSGPRV